MCKACESARKKRDYPKHADKLRASNRLYVARNASRIAARKAAYYEDNKQRINEVGKRYRASVADLRRAKRKRYYEANKDRISDYSKRYYEANKQRYFEVSNRYRNARRRRDNKYRTRCNLRTRFYHALKGLCKRSSVMDLLDCSVDQLVNHLQNHFAPGMSWDNYGDWHVDHIIPLSAFDDPQDPRAWGRSNLRPMWGSENCAKGGVNRMSDEQKNRLCA